MPALVAQLEQAIGAGALTPAVIPYVGQARRLAARIEEARGRARVPRVDAADAVARERCAGQTLTIP